MGGGQNRVETGGGLFGDVVDDDVVVFTPCGEFLGGVAEAFLDGFLRFGAAAAKALFESRDGWRCKEDGNDGRSPFRLGEDGFADESHALHVDVENDVLTVENTWFNFLLQRAVVVAVDFRPFEEVVCVDAAFEFVDGEEMVCDAIDFAWPRGARRAGDGELKLCVFLKKVRADGGFSDAAWAGKDDGGSDVFQGGVGGVGVWGRSKWTVRLSNNVILAELASSMN